MLKHNISENSKALLKILCLSFVAAFIGAVWVGAPAALLGAGGAAMPLYGLIGAIAGGAIAYIVAAKPRSGLFA